MINLTTAKRLDKLNLPIIQQVMMDKNDNYYPNPTIEELLELLPAHITYKEKEEQRGNYVATLTMEKWDITNTLSDYTVKYCNYYRGYERFTVHHKNLAEALARLLIKLTEEGLI